MLLAALIRNKAGRKNLESQSVIYSQFYVVLMRFRIKPNDDCVFSANSLKEFFKYFQGGVMDNHRGLISANIKFISSI